MCPKCKSKKTEIYNSRKNGKHRGSVWRRRNCLKCFHSWTTIEVSQKHYDELSRQASSLETLRTLEETATDIIGKVKGLLSENGDTSHVYDDSYDPNRDYLQYIQDKKSREAKRLSNLRPVNRKEK
jgi:hypothetical protein